MRLRVGGRNRSAGAGLASVSYGFGLPRAARMTAAIGAWRRRGSSTSRSSRSRCRPAVRVVVPAASQWFDETALHNGSLELDAPAAIAEIESLLDQQGFDAQHRQVTYLADGTCSSRTMACAHLVGLHSTVLQQPQDEAGVDLATSG